MTVSAGTSPVSSKRRRKAKRRNAEPAKSDRSRAVVRPIVRVSPPALEGALRPQFKRVCTSLATRGDVAFGLPARQSPERGVVWLVWREGLARPSSPLDDLGRPREHLEVALPAVLFD